MAAKIVGRQAGDREIKMKITKSKLVQIIKEEIETISEEREATGNRYTRAPVPAGKAPDEDALKKKHKKLVTPDFKKKLEKRLAKAAKERKARLAGEIDEAYGPSDSDYGYYPSRHPLAGLPFLETSPEEAYEFYAITLKKIANAMGEDMTFEDALAAVEDSRKSGKGLDVPNLEEGKQ